MKKAWDPVTLRVDFWRAQQPVAGDELRTNSGRRYQILSFNGKALKCLVLPADAPVQGYVFRWEWSSRAKRYRSTAPVAH